MMLARVASPFFRTSTASAAGVDVAIQVLVEEIDVVEAAIERLDVGPIVVDSHEQRVHPVRHLPSPARRPEERTNRCAAIGQPSRRCQTLLDLVSWAKRRLWIAIRRTCVEAIEVHHLGPRRRRSRARTSPSRRRSHRPRPARAARSSSRRRDRPGWRSTCASPFVRQRPSNASAASDVGFHSVPMSMRLTKKSLVSAPGRFVKTPWLGRAGGRVQRAQAADEHGHLRRAQRQPEGALDQQVLGGHMVPGAEVVAEAVRVRLEHGERFDVGLLLRRIRAPGRERHVARRSRRPSPPSRRRRSRPGRSGRPARSSSGRRPARR